MVVNPWKLVGFSMGKTMWAPAAAGTLKISELGTDFLIEWDFKRKAFYGDFMGISWGFKDEHGN